MTLGVSQAHLPQRTSASAAVPVDCMCAGRRVGARVTAWRRHGMSSSGATCGQPLPAPGLSRMKNRRTTTVMAKASSSLYRVGQYQDRGPTL